MPSGPRGTTLGAATPAEDTGYGDDGYGYAYEYGYGYGHGRHDDEYGYGGSHEYAEDFGDFDEFDSFDELDGFDDFDDFEAGAKEYGCWLVALVAVDGKSYVYRVYAPPDALLGDLFWEAWHCHDEGPHPRAYDVFDTAVIRHIGNLHQGDPDGDSDGSSVL